MEITDSITETQTVTFILDKSKDCSVLTAVNISQYQKAIVFCDEKLKDSWWPPLKNNLSKRISIKHCEFLPAAESTKTVDSYARLVNILSEHHCSRDDLLIAIGGGTILDVAGFLASTYMRGIPLLMIPTTLIGQADASTAGKTCLNTEYAKNILGTLYLPTIVYNNIAILKTNSPHYLRQGFSEIFKYGLLGSKKLLHLLDQYHQHPEDDIMLDILRETIAVRLRIRKKHPLASNLGHTFGHALEKYSNFAVDHGDAISVGIVMALEFSVLKNILRKDLKDEIISSMKKMGLNTKIDKNIDPKEIINIMQKDKKSSNTQIRLVLIKEISEPFDQQGDPFYPVDSGEMERFLIEFMNKKQYVQEGLWQFLREK